MELTLAIAIGVLTGSGVWLVLRPRTYQLVIGLSLLSYAVNLFIFSMGRLRIAYLAMFQQDLKGLLAYSTISHPGLIVLLLSLGSPLGAVAAIFHMLNHATFKASLFMAAGVIDHGILRKARGG